MFTVLSLTGLSGAVDETDSQEPLRFILLTPFANYQFFDPVKKGMADAALSLGVEAIFGGAPDGDMEALAEEVRQASRAGFDGIALNIFDAAALKEAVASATDGDVPVIAFNVDDQRTETARMAAIGQNVRQAGREFGKAVQEFIPRGSHVLLTMHDPGISALQERAAGAQEVLSTKGIIWTSMVTGSGNKVAAEKIRAALEADPSIRFVLGTGTADTEVAGQVIERYFPDRGYFCAGFDLSPEILRLVKAGVIRLTVDQQPYAQGYYAVVGLTLYRRYGLKPSNIDTGAAIITADMVDELIDLTRQHYR